MQKKSGAILKMSPAHLKLWQKFKDVNMTAKKFFPSLCLLFSQVCTQKDRFFSRAYTHRIILIWNTMEKNKIKWGENPQYTVFKSFSFLSTDSLLSRPPSDS